MIGVKTVKGAKLRHPEAIKLIFELTCNANIMMEKKT
jgi:hypothetical protein